MREEIKIMNKSALKEKAKKILNDYPIGHIFDKDSEEYHFLFRIFQGHPEYGIKVGSGISGIFIGKSEVYNNRCFNIERIDGSSTDISYLQSVDGANSKISDIRCACRSAIRPIISAFRETIRFEIDVCPISGEVLTKQNTDIDHFNKTFDKLFKLWVKPLNINSLHAYLNNASKDHVTDIYFTHQGIINNFVKFHNANTHLRAVTKQANISILKRKNR